MEGSKRNIPVKMGDFSIIDTEFSSIRERFDAEMRKMEDEMNKFRSELISREMPSIGQSSITSRSRTSEYHRVVDGKEEEHKRETSETVSQQRREPAAAAAERARRPPSAASRMTTELTLRQTSSTAAPSRTAEQPAAGRQTGPQTRQTSRTASGTATGIGGGAGTAGVGGGGTQPAPQPASQPASQATSKTTSRSSSTHSQQQSAFPSSSLAPRSDPSTWLDNLNSPLIQDEGDQKQLKLRFDVSQYKPEEIVVKTVDNKLLVHAKHEEKSDSRSVYREYNREFLLPQGSNPEMIKSSLSKDGILTVEAPLPALEGGRGHIPITHQ